MIKYFLSLFIVAALLGGCESKTRGDMDLKLEGIVISEESHKSGDDDEVIYSNIDYLNSLFEEYIYSQEVSDDALKSYYVDYYLAQVNNGGFSQFVYNSGWKSEMINYVRQGLKEMGATRNLELFNKSAEILDELGEERIEEYLDSEYFGTNEERDILNSFNDRFYDLQKSEDLISLNAAWIKKHPKLEVLKKEDYKNRIISIAESIPDRNLREQKSLEAEPRFMKLIRALCKEADHILERVTAGDPTNEYKGVQILAWHFITNKGHHYMIDYKGEAIMFNGDSSKVVISISAGSEYGVQ